MKDRIILDDEIALIFFKRVSKKKKTVLLLDYKTPEGRKTFNSRKNKQVV